MITRPTIAELFADRDGAWIESVTEALVAHESSGSESPVAIRILVGVGAWLASLFLIGFAVIAGLADEGVGWVTGGVALGGSIALRRSAGAGSIFRNQFALSVGAMGQLLLVFHAAESFDFRGGLFFAVLLALVMLAVFPDPVQRFASTITAVLCLTGAMAEGPDALAVADMMAIWVAAGVWVLFEHETALQRSALADWQLPVAFGLVVSLAVLLMPSIAGAASATRPLVTGAMAIGLIALGYRAGREIKPPLTPNHRVGGILVVVALAWLTAMAPGIMAGLLAMGLGLRRSHPVLFVGAAGFFVAFVVAFYYHLDVSLLAKSAALIGAGLLLLVARAGLLRGAA